MAKEIWRPIPGLNGKYMASSLGRIISRQRRKARLMKIQTNSGGYQTVTIYSDRHPKWGGSEYVHDLVALTFIGPKPPGACVLHYDDDPTNNRVFNLRYGSMADNMLDAKFNSAPDRQVQMEGSVTYHCDIHKSEVTDRLTGEFDTSDCPTYESNPDRCVDCLAQSGVV